MQYANLRYVFLGEIDNYKEYTPKYSFWHCAYFLGEIDNYKEYTPRHDIWSNSYSLGEIDNYKEYTSYILYHILEEALLGDIDN